MADRASKCIICFLVCECLVVLLSAVAERVELQQDETGYVPCPPIANKVFNISQIRAAYWYKGLTATRSLISYFDNGINLNKKLPRGKYELREDFSLVINNVTDSDGGAYVWQLKPKAGALTEGVVNVTIVGPGSSSPSQQSDGLPPGVIAAIVIAALVVIIMCAVLVYKIWVRRRWTYRRPAENEPDITMEDVPMEEIHDIRSVADKFLKHLRTFYKHEMETIPIHPADHSKTSSFIIFPEMYKLSHKISKAKPRQKLKSLNDLMKLLAERSHVALLGSAGCGKATLIRKMGYDWACLVSSLNKPVFKYLVVLRMKEIRDTVDILEAIRRILPKDFRITNEKLKELLVEIQEDLLIIVDGSCLSSEEFPGPGPEGEWSLRDVLSFNVLRDCSLLVTVDSHQLEQLQSYYNKYTVVETDGFSSENIVKYINQFFEGDKRVAKGLVRLVQSCEITGTIAKSPIMLLVLCLMWYKDKSLPRLAEIFDRAVDVLVEHVWRGSTGKPDPQEVEEFKMGIGEVAVKGLLNASERSDFLPSEFPDDGTLKFGLKIGALSKATRTIAEKQESFVTFSRTYYQEYLAACYLIHSNIEELLSHLTLETVQKKEILIRFCCGKSINTQSVITNHLQGLMSSGQQTQKESWLQKFTRNLPKM